MSTFFSFKALMSMRSSGYKNTQYALAELIDNSIDAGAKNIKVIFLENRIEGKKAIQEILVCDDGDGMDDRTLYSCLQFGGGNNKDIDEIVKKGKIGKFGFGLPNASLSQCQVIKVFSKTSSSGWRSQELSLPELRKLDEDASIKMPNIKTEEIPSYYQEIDASFSESGTIVSWKDCDLLSNSKAKTIIEKSHKLIGRIYRYILKKDINIKFISFFYTPSKNKFIKEEEVSFKPNDPLFLMENTLISEKLHHEAQNIGSPSAKCYSKFSKSMDECYPTNHILEDHSYNFDFKYLSHVYNFELKCSYADINIQKPGIREGGNTRIGHFYGDQSRKSISFVRSDREISQGNFGFYTETDPRCRWWGVEVKFSPNADDLMGVHNNKQDVTFQYSSSSNIDEPYDELRASFAQAKEELWSELSRRIERAVKELRKIVNNQHKEWELNNQEEGEGPSPILPGGTPGTRITQIDVDGTRKTQFTEDQKRQLFDRLSEKYENIPDEEIKKAIEKFDEWKVRGCVLYAESESASLWTLTNVVDFLIVLINTNHEFYEKVILPFKNARFEDGVTALELFISALAFEENEHFSSKETEKNVLEKFRSFVGIHLNDYIRQNKTRIDESDFKDKSEEDDEGDF